MDSSLLRFLNPKGIVVIGTSSSPEKLGYGVARNLIASGYPGALHFVGQKRGSLFDRPIYSDLLQVPPPVDLAILIVPPDATPDTIEACGRYGIHAAVIVSAGFREVGAEGAALEKRCLESARKHGVRLLGPNCIGTIDTHLPLDTTFLQPPMPSPGGIGFISHSGAFCAAIVDWSRGQGFGFSQIVSLGNQADVNETDMLPIIAADTHTHVIVLYLESVSDGKKFVQVARQVALHKPVIALKVGRFEAGQKAAASHTGALAASDIAFEAAFTKAGILRADSAEQVFDWARALENCPLPRGKRIAILTNAGGPGVIAADSIETHGLILAKLSSPSLNALSATLPPAASILNPVDMLASASPKTYAACLKILLEDENVDGAMVILPPPPLYKAEEVAEHLVEVINRSGKPVVIALMGSSLIGHANGVFTRSKVPAFPFPERAASALNALVTRAEILGRGPQTTEHVAQEPSSIVGVSADELLAAYSISTVQVKLAKSAKECVSIAKLLGFPVVLKIASLEIPHKSDIGGVLLDIKDDSSAQNGYAALLERAGQFAPHARIEGVYVQRQISGGQEVIAGAVRDPLFGPLMMFGSGGAEVEGLRDVAFALAPLTQAEAREMIRKTWAGRKLKGFRNIAAADEEAVIDVLLKLSRLVTEHPEVEELEINPLLALSTGAMAVDVRIKISAA